MWTEKPSNAGGKSKCHCYASGSQGSTGFRYHAGAPVLAPRLLFLPRIGAVSLQAVFRSVQCAVCCFLLELSIPSKEVCSSCCEGRGQVLICGFSLNLTAMARPLAPLIPTLIAVFALVAAEGRTRFGCYHCENIRRTFCGRRLQQCSDHVIFYGFPPSQQLHSLALPPSPPPVNSSSGRTRKRKNKKKQGKFNK